MPRWFFGEGRGLGYGHEANRYEPVIHNDGEPGQLQNDYVQGDWGSCASGYCGYSRFPSERRCLALSAPRRQCRVGTHKQLRCRSLWFPFTAADIGGSLAALALTFGLYLSIAPPGRSYVGLFLLGLYGVSVLLAGIFPIDVGGEATTFGIVGNIAFFGFPIAVILLSLGMGKDERWRSFRRPALALSFVVVLTVILTIVGSNLGIGYGVTQRIANVAALVWMLLVALHLRSVARGTLAQQPSRVR